MSVANSTLMPISRRDESSSVWRRQERLSLQMSRVQAQRFEELGRRAYQPAQFQSGISAAEAERRIAALNAEIELANSF
jgi:hypothetical protein